MKTLLLLRHAKSRWKNLSLADHDRPLNSRGKTDAPKMGKFLKTTDLVPDIILCSSAKRAKQTIKGFLEEFPFDGEIIFNRSLYHGSTEDFLDVLHNLEDKINTVMIVGHNPGMEIAIEDLTGHDEFMPTGAIAQLAFRINRWAELDQDLSGQLVALWQPREIEF